MKNYFIQNPDSIIKMIKATSSRILGLLLIFILNLNISFGQSVTTEKAFASGCYFYGGNSKTTISVQVGWTVAVNGDLIKVVLDGSTTRTIKPESFYDPGTGSAIAGPMVTPQVVAFEINADGISHKIEVDLFSSTNVLKASAADVFVTSPTPCAPVACSGTSLGGTVYYDNNANGIHDAGETQGIDNVTITAFDKNGNVYNATSDGYGKYAFSAALGNNIAAANFPVRLEFTNWPSNVMSNSGPSITGNKSGVRFVAAAACNVDCGGVYPLNYSQSNPKIFNNIYTNGDPLAGGTAGTEPGLVAHDYTNNTDFNFQTIVQSKLIGSVWAKAWNKFEKKLVVSAFLKRHCGLGPLGLGGLYILNYTNPGSPVFSQLIDITTLGIDLGQAGVPTNAARGLLANKDTPNKDAAVFGLIGKAGIGNMDFSEDGNMLYLMNLYDRKIYSINFTNYWNTGTLPTAADVTSYAVPDPGCTGGDFRPFALKVYNNVLYAGLVCDGSTGTKSNMVAYVKGMDLTTNAWFDVFDFPLTYPKGYPDQQDGSKVGWYKWSDVMTDVWSGSGSILHPVPILSDIEFDLDGTMVLALMDRTPMQMGHENYDNPPLNGGAFIATGGDVLRAFYSNGAYVLENAAKAGPNIGFYPTNNQGPGFGEFYNDNIDGGVKYHTEMVTGGLVLVPGSGEVLAGMVDPNFYAGGPLYANGVRRLSNTTGNHTGGFTYVAGNTVDNFGKGIGIGDMEAATDNLTYLEVGNYVWRDTDADGIQDPAETGIKDIILKLYKSSDGSLIGTATTDANGNYYFSTLNGLTILPNTDYCILAGVGQYVSGTITLAGVSYSLTAFNTGQGADPDLNDNDFSGTVLSTALGARPAGYPQFCVKTGEYGYINHTIDLGLIPCSISGTATAGSCNDNGTPYNTTDDYFQVSVNATNGAAGPANQYEVVYNNVVIGTGTYGSSITVGTSTTPPFKPDGSSTYDLYIRDKDHKDCITGVLKVGPVVPCPKYYDYGDLPDTNSGLPNSYPTNNNNGGEGVGANHLIIEGLKIGATIDSESDGQPNAGATGDGNDEDGVVLPMFIAGQTATIPVTVMNMTGGSAKLTMFIDFNKNGNLDEVSEMTSANVPTGTNGVVNLTIAVPANAVANQNLGVRFRLSTDAVASMKATGQAPDGEVEDYITQVMAYDYGDLPDTDNGTGSYPTNVTSGGEGVGASHKIITGLKIGATIDAEGDGQPNITATGDDGDEDGVVLPMLIAGKTATVPVTVMNTTGSTAKLTMFVDFNYDHDFNDAGEMVSANVVTGTNGIVNLSLPVPADAVLNKEVGVRFRLSTNATQSMSPTGAAVDGEVEDYLVTVMGFDYGDLADTNNGGGSYPTNVTNGGEGVGPSHKIIEGLKIGNTIDAEGDGQPSTLADGDDNNGTSADDEDGVTLPAFNTGNTAIVPVKVMNMTGSTAKLTMFIDFNNNKSFADAGEMTSINVPAGTNSTLNLSIAVPVNAATNQNLGVRFRLSTDAAISMLPTGAAPDGEVEDYVTSITGSIITHNKSIKKVTNTGLNTYLVEYTINVINNGTGSGTYSLNDRTAFDDDIDISSASYTSNAPGNLGPVNLVGSGIWTLASNQVINANTTHTYTVGVNVKIDLLDGVKGDDKYFACGKAIANYPSSGEGLFNESRLDIYADGSIDEKDTACADLPFIIHDKTLTSVTPAGVNTYDVVYGIQVKNIGGASGQYDLQDEPRFDDDITQVSAKYLSSITGVTTTLGVPGPWLLANNQIIAAGATQNFTLTVRAKIDLEDGVVGDDKYTACGTATPGIPTQDEGLFNRSLLDVNDDGKYDYRDSVCADLPYIIHEKLIDNVVSTGINKYKITYKINVKNIGGAVGSYNLSDAPGFDDDITITASQYSTNAIGNAGNPGPVNLAGSGPWTLATNQNINPNVTQTYTIPVDVSVNLEAGSGGDNILKSCGQTVPGVPRVGEGLFNRSLLDLDKNGTPDKQDSVCYDIPYIIHDKEIVSVVPNGANQYTVNYKITVKNVGTVAGTYGLADAPKFDNDIDILSANYTSNAPGFGGPTNLAGAGPWTLSSNVNLGAAGTHTYNLAVNVKIDLIDGVSGDDTYFKCNRSSTTNYTAGEGLFNESRLDLNNDGVADMRDTVCADLPFIIHAKTIFGVTPTGVNTYDIVYGIDVKNIGGAIGQYDLRDEPKFDDDIAQTSAKYLSSVTGVTTNLPVPGPWMLATNQSIAAGATQKYTLTVGTKIDLEDGLSGDNRYSACESGTPGFPKENEGLFNRSLLDVNRDGKFDYRDSVCADIPYIIHEKLIDNVVPTGINKYKITYKIIVKNIGGAIGSYNLTDAPGFDDDINITAAQYSTNATGNTGNPGPKVLALIGPWTLATNQNINANEIQTYTLPVDVSISLEAGSGGDNILKSCGQTVPGIPRVGEGLFNRSLLDLDKNGTPDRQDSVCNDLPYIIHDKELVSVVPNGANKYIVNYKITVKNIGTVVGNYGLADAPKFDDDIDIQSASYTSNAPGFTGPTNLVGNGPWTLSTNENIGAGTIHTYNLAVNVKIDLSDALSGDNKYYACNRSSTTNYTAGEGLFNESRLDLNNDGIADMRDTVCADLPYVEHEKFFTSVTKTGLGLYTVKYKVEVKNRGGAVGKYDLIDNPGLDDDFEILNAKLSSDASGNPATPGPIAIPNSGPWVFANDQNITPGVVQTYNLTLDVKIDLQTASSAGDEIYHYCGTIIPGIPSKGEGLFNESTLDVNNDGIPDQRDTVCQDVEIVDLALRKTVVTPAPYSYGQNINFKIEVINQGNVTMNQVEVADYLPKGYTLAAGNVGWSGVYPTYKKTIAGPLTPGSILTTNIILKLEQTSGGRMDWINYAEISKVVNSRNQDVTLDDEDSRPSSDGPAERAVKPGDPKDDDIFSRDKGGEEDDHDPAGIEVYDLALRKIYKGNYPIHYNDIVPFEITIFNQGNLTAKEIGVVDYVPEGYDWVVAQNGGWSFNSGTRMATQTYPGSIVPGDSAKLTVYLKVLVNYSGIQAWDNYSEIKSTKDTFGVVRLKDIDSYFDMTIDNDMGGVPNTKTDNFINDDGNDGDGDGIKDEDDHDPSRPEIVDLALRKWVLNKKAYYIPGEIVPYTLTVFNQGNVIMNSVTVNDYLYSGYGFEAGLNSGWTLVGNTLTKTQGGPLNPKDSMQFQLKLRVQVPVGASVESWWNYGEVRSMSDSNDKVRDNDDADSKPNSDTPYERSVKPGDPWDNVIDGQGLTENEDEDDHDPEKVIVTGYIGDYVWKDDNGNGIQDATEHGVKGVEVLLYDCKTNTIVKKDTTDVNGEYGFEFLLSGNYQLKFINPDTNTCIFTFKDKGANDRKDNDANQLGITDCIFLDWGKRDSTVDAGLILSASYGDFVWHDRNANGLQESGEEAIPNVEVSLYDGDTKLPVSKLFTDANGLYRFTKLLPGNYFAKYVADPMWNQSDPNTGNDLKDSDVDGSNGSKTNATTYLSVGEDDLSWDAGYWKCSMVSGRVFFDADMNGIFGLYDNGINGLEVYLVDANTGITIAKVLTRVNPSTPSDDGYYKFNCVKPGNYYLRFERPGSYAASEPYKGGNPDKDSDISHENGLNTTKTFKVLSDNMFLNIGAGFQTKATVGDYVWLDANFNGLQDSGEQPVEGVKVYAYKSNGTMVSQSVSQTDGHYTLDGIAQGDYFVKFVPPTNLFFTAAHTGNDDIDNDADGANGYGTTRTYRINSGDSRPTIDAGLVFQMLPLEWLSFEGRYNGSFTKLDWKTGIELNNDHFEVERRHESELAFTKISQVAASSNGQSKLHEYDYDDYDVTKSGVYYYRIKQVDKNGLNTYSRVISIKVDSKKDLSLSIYPNPTDEQLIVEMGLGEDSDLEVKVFDEAGKNVFTNPFGGFRKAGNYRDVIDTKILSVGHYNLQIKTTGGLINKRFTVMR